MVKLHLFERIPKGAMYVAYDVVAPVDVPEKTIVTMHVDGRLLQVRVPLIDTINVHETCTRL